MFTGFEFVVQPGSHNDDWLGFCKDKRRVIL
jgi:hypothetical protein